MRLTCDPCQKDHNHDGCARWVRAFIDPGGPDTYACECYCNERRRRKATADRKVKEVLDAYRREFGAEALAAAVAEHLGSSPQPDSTDNTEADVDNPYGG